MGKFYISVLHFKSRLIWALNPSVFGSGFKYFVRTLEQLRKYIMKYYEFELLNARHYYYYLTTIIIATTTFGILVFIHIGPIQLTIF